MCWLIYFVVILILLLLLLFCLYGRALSSKLQAISINVLSATHLMWIWVFLLFPFIFSSIFYLHFASIFKPCHIKLNDCSKRKTNILFLTLRCVLLVTVTAQFQWNAYMNRCDTNFHSDFLRYILYYVCGTLNHISFPCSHSSLPILNFHLHLFLISYHSWLLFRTYFDMISFCYNKKSKYVVKDIISFLLHFHCMFMCTKNNEKSPLRTQTY